MLLTETEHPVAQSEPQQPNPAMVFEFLNRFQHSMALKGAIDLDLFTHIQEGASSPDELAIRCRASERGVRILCDFLTITGFLSKNKGKYALTVDSAFLLSKRSPGYMGSIAQFLVSEDSVKSFRNVAGAVRKGGTLDVVDGAMAPESEVWVNFAKSMHPIAAFSSRLMAPIVSQPGRQIKVLDIAAGHGLFGIGVAQHNPAAQIYALDWANVLKVAAENAEMAGVADRFHMIPGSAFDVEMGSGYDLVLLPNLLHHFNKTENVALLRKIRAAMNPGGTVATLEFVPNEDRVSPPIPAAFSLIMLMRTDGGDAYTFRELDEMFRTAGFGGSRMQDLAPSPQQLILTSR